MHSNIPLPHVLGQAFTTSTRPPPVLELNNRYSILPIEGTNDSFVENDDRVVRAPPKLTKRLASSSSQVKASNEKTTTISSPIITMMHQSRPSFGKFQAAVTNARSDGVEQASNANSDKAALLAGKVPPRGYAETSPGMEQIARTSQLKLPGKTAAAMKTFPSHDQSPGSAPPEARTSDDRREIGNPEQNAGP